MKDSVDNHQDADDLSDEEREQAEQARISSGDYMGSVPGKPKVFWPNFLRMIGLLKDHMPLLAVTTILGIISVVLSVLAPKVLGEATNTLFEGAVSSHLPKGVTQEQAVAGLRASGHPQMADMLQAMHVTPGVGLDFSLLGKILMTVVALYVVAALLSWLQGYILNRIMVRSIWSLREQVEKKINHLPLSYFDKMRRGDLISRMTNDIDNINQTMLQSLSSVLTSVLTLFGVLIMMFSLSWVMTLVVLATLPLSGIIFGVIGPKSQKAFTKQWAKVGQLNSRVEESFSGHALIKTYGRQEDAQQSFEKDNDELFHASFVAQFLSNIMLPAVVFIQNLSYVAMAVIGAVMVATGQLRLGTVQALIQYSQQFSQPLGQLGSMAATVQSATASAERVFAVLDASEQDPDPTDPPEPATGDGHMSFDHIAFSYDADHPLITDLSFEVHPGHTVAIVGPTGAGKTTLVNLIMRFYELDSGSISINDQNIASLTRDQLRHQVAMVLQDPWIFSGTIRENIRYGRDDATDDEIIAAARASYVDRFVSGLPDGYDTIMEEGGANISAGERQLITIARAFLAERPVLILDEATSSVDTRTELLLQRAMSSLRKDKTSFVIAHRLSTIRDANLILVMDNGNVVEKGTHKELLANEGPYYRLYHAQALAGTSE